MGTKQFVTLEHNPPNSTFANLVNYCNSELKHVVIAAGDLLHGRTQNPEPRTQNPEPRTQNPEPRTQNPELRTKNLSRCHKFTNGIIIDLATVH